MKKNLLLTMAALTMGIAAMTGCSTMNSSAAAGVETMEEIVEEGILVLRVNPEIEINYNKQGLVTSLSGINNDGSAIVADYQDYIGKTCETVVQELVTEIEAAGYFVSDVDGNYRNITVQIEPGSVLPKDDFIDSITASVQYSVQEMNLSSKVVGIDQDDYDDRYQRNNKPSQYITKDKAIEIALTHAGVKREGTRFDDREFDFDDGTAIYELEFYHGSMEYEYDIDAVTGKIIKHKSDLESHNSAASAPSQTTPAKNYITKEEAIAIALNHAGVRSGDARFDDKEFDLDDGSALYELEFYANGKEHEFDIDARDGKVLKYEVKNETRPTNNQKQPTNTQQGNHHDDDWDDDNDDWDDDNDDRDDDNDDRDDDNDDRDDDNDDWDDDNDDRDDDNDDWDDDHDDDD